LNRRSHFLAVLSVLVLCVLGFSENGSARSSTPDSAPSTPIVLPKDTVLTLGIASHPYYPRHGIRRIHITGVVALIDDRISYATARSVGISTQIFGRVRKVYADTGDYVVKSQVLATVFSPDYIEAQQEYLQAIALAQISGSGPGNTKFSDQITNAALLKLENLGVVEKDIERLRTSKRIRRHLPIRSAINGYVIQKNAIAGQTIYTGDRLFTIGNTDWVRVNSEVYQQDIREVSLGQGMEIRIPDSHVRLSGHVIYISPVADPQTRTVLVRGLFKNEGLSLRPGMFVSVDILVPYKGRHLWVPRESVFLEKDRSVVFVQLDRNRFQMVPVEPGRTEEGWVPIRTHLPPGTRIVDRNGFWVKAQFEKFRSRQLGE
jgi:Cu(I)/Ag(I) efflux system membrane fusion protein